MVPGVLGGGCATMVAGQHDGQLWHSFTVDRGFPCPNQFLLQVAEARTLASGPGRQASHLGWLFPRMRGWGSSMVW